MQNYLKYTAYRQDGIFGQFTFETDDAPFCVTVTHAFPSEVSGATYVPIVLPGTYTCQRGTHQLDNGGPFETFEIMGVEGHGGLLFHPGNYNKDSKGGQLVGEAIAHYDAAGDEMVTNSKATFLKWMARLDGVQSFNLVVT